jgi:flagellar motor switch protein FliG
MNLKGSSQKSTLLTAAFLGAVLLCRNAVAQMDLPLNAAGGNAANVNSNNASNFSGNNGSLNNISSLNSANGNFAKTNNVAPNAVPQNSFQNSAVSQPPVDPAIAPSDPIPSNTSSLPPPASEPPMLAQAAPSDGNQGGIEVSSTQLGPDPEKRAEEERIAEETKRLLLSDLRTSCLDYCNVLSAHARLDEVFDSANADLGFESVATRGGKRYRVKEVVIDVLVDTRFGTTNFEKLQVLVRKLSENYPYRSALRFAQLPFPDSVTSTRSEVEVRADFAGQMRNQLERIAGEFCPFDCKIHSVDPVLQRAAMDEAQSGVGHRYIFVRDGKGVLYVRGVNADVSLNSQMDPTRRQRIESLMRQHLAPYGSINLKTNFIAFPRSADEISKDVDAVRADPYGVEKISRLLQVFKEHANTKEVYREKEIGRETSRSDSTKDSSKEMARETRESENNSETSSSENSKSSENSREANKDGGSFWNANAALIIGGILLVLLIAGAVALRFVLSGKRMQAIVHEGLAGRPAENGEGGAQRAGENGFAQESGSKGSQAFVLNNERLQQRFEHRDLKDDIVQTLASQPKVARDVFGRILREDGIEYAAKCVAIFGEMMIFELLGDADLKGELSTLAEYVHVNLPKLESEEQIEILKNLRLRVTASKMRLMTQKTLDVFDFLKSRSPKQVYDLVRDETPKSQSIVLTQLATEKRRSVFEMFEGIAKVELLRELSSADMVPKEYIHNVAEALKRKALSIPSFDGENIRGTDVLIDLLEQSELADQRDLMSELDSTNPDASRYLRGRLITLETLLYIRDGVMVDIFLSVDQNTMTDFLAGTREHVRSAVLSKAPPDLSIAWRENLVSAGFVDKDAYKLAEMQVLTKIRSLASSGSINLAEINNSLYPALRGDGGMYDGQGNPESRKRTFKISKPLVA